jgi:hypothetical protein
VQSNVESFQAKFSEFDALKLRLLNQKNSGKTEILKLEESLKKSKYESTMNENYNTSFQNSMQNKM